MYDEGQLILFMFILMRMTGFVVLNPIWGRTGVPSMVKAGFAFALTIAVYFLVPNAEPNVPATAIELAVTVLIELAFGYIIAMVMQCFFYAVLLAGHSIDTQMGLTMSEQYDASMGTNVSLTGNIFQIALVLLFFIEGGHITMMRTILTSSQIVPFGQITINEGIASYVLDLFASCGILALKLAMPIVVASLIGQFVMGILMKVIPQINIFVINIDLKILLGMALLLILISPFGEFILSMDKQMLVAIEDAVQIIGQ